MEFNIYRMANMKVPGEVYNFQACFEARDKHFDCMDSLKDNKGF